MECGASLIAIDTNILVYAHRNDSAFQSVASEKVLTLATGRSAWAIPWPCIHEFLAVVTNAKVFADPTPSELARMQLSELMKSSSLSLIGETNQHWSVLDRLLSGTVIRGNRIHDAKIAAICIQHGVRALWTADRDFSRFPRLKTVNPLTR